MDENALREKVYLHLEGLLPKVDEEQREWMKDAIGIVTVSKDGGIMIRSGIITNIRDWDEVYTRQSREDTEREFQKRENWEKWRDKAPALIADLEKCENFARESAAKHGVNLRMIVDRTRAHFVAEIDARGLQENVIPQQVYKHIDAMFEAWNRFTTWLHSSERLNIARNKTV